MKHDIIVASNNLKTTDDKQHPKSVNYRVLVKTAAGIKKIGTVIIDSFNGDIYYVPSQKALVTKNTKDPNRVIDHISFHESGKVHIKFMDRTREDLPSRGPLREIGYQLMVEDHIYDLHSLPDHRKKVTELDQIFWPPNIVGATFRFSIISGRLIAHPTALPEVTIRSNKTDGEDLLCASRMALGWHSGNADKLLQYAIHRLKKDRPETGSTKRTIFLPQDQGISRPSNHS